jgi:hypothetical protein
MTGARPQINEQIVSYNKRLHKVTKKYKHVKLVRVTTSWNNFTTHGLHLNYKGKEAMTKEILNNLTSNCKCQSLPAIKLPWKNEYENVNAPIIGKETSKEVFDKKADTEEARETLVITGGKHIESETGIEAILLGKFNPNETVQHVDKHEISRNPKSQHKCPKVKKMLFMDLKMSNKAETCQTLHYIIKMSET